MKSAGAYETCLATVDARVFAAYWIETKVVFPADNIQVGDVVVVIDPNAARREWKVGRIEQTYPGPDRLVRVVDVRVKDKVLK